MSKGFCILAVALAIAAFFNRPVFAVSETAIKGWAGTHHTHTQDAIFHTAKEFGEVKYALPAIGALYAYGRHNNNVHLSQTAVLGMDSILLADAVTGVIKLATNRHRPKTGVPHDTWAGLHGSTLEASSFPSGHSATAFAAATIIANQYANNKGIVNAAYGMAALTAYSRIYDNEHWASDVLVCSAIGYYSAKFIIKHHRGGESNSAPTAFPLLLPLVIKLF